MPTEIGLRLFHGYGREIIWHPGFFSPGAMFYGENQYREWLIQDFVYEVGRQWGEVEAEFFSLDEIPEYIRKLSAENRFFHPHRYVGTADDLLEELLTFRRSVRKHRETYHRIESIDQPIRLLLLDFESFKTYSENLAIDLLSNSSPERIFPFVLLKDITEFSENLWKTIPWAGYFGSGNVRFAEQLYGDLTRISDERWETPGVFTHQHSPELCDVYQPRHRVHSKWFLDMERYYTEHDAAYEKFLESLEDGE